ncbi:MAG: DNA polymerase IV [Polyangiales bacterium]
MTRAILHLDMDAFYASVEQRDDPSLRGRPVIVGGSPRRGVVLAASYEVRPFGVRSAMPMARALRLAPGAVVVRPRFDAYVEASERLHAILESVTPLVEPLSLDEAFLDVTGSRALFGDGESIARSLRARIRDELALPCSAGVAAVKFVAKIASDLAKPDGLRAVPAEETVRFLAALPTWRLWGVGPKMEARLAAMGFRTVGDLAAHPREALTEALGAAGAHLAALARGEDDRAVVPDRDAKSVGAEDTFADDLATPEGLHPRILSQCLRVGRRLRRAGVAARAVVLKLKTRSFELATRRTTLDAPTDDGMALFRAARGLLDRYAAEGPFTPMRLCGVSAQELVAPDAQLGLFAGARERGMKLNAALDAIHARYGRTAVVPADLAGRSVRGDTLSGDARIAESLDARRLRR